MRTFLQHVTEAIAESKRQLLADYPDLDRDSMQAHLMIIGRESGSEWWRTLEDAAYRGGCVPLSAWRSALSEHERSARGLLGRWIRSRPSDCPEARKAAAMAQEWGKP